MKTYKWPLVFLNLFIFLVVFNYSLFQKEEILKNGKVILFELAPVDPRSLMQGDYMQLRYKIPNEITLAEIPKRGYCLIHPDSNGVMKEMHLEKDKIAPGTNEYLIKYTFTGNGINIGAESYFFEEGQGEKFALAKYGGIKIDDNGNSVLVGLYDEKLNQIK